MTNSYNASNVSSSNVSFDNVTLLPGQSISITHLTQSVLDAYNDGRVLLDPKPNQQEITQVSLLPCLPMPVRIVGGIELNAPGRIDDGFAANVTDAVTQLFASDLSRLVIRLRNVGTNTVYIGGRNVDPTTAFHVIPPGATFEEHYAANVDWFAICEDSAITTLVGYSVHAQ